MARYRMANGKQRGKVFKTLREAREWKRQQEAEVKQMGIRATDPRAAKTPVKDVAAVWLASKQHLERTTVVAYEEMWRSTIEPKWGDVPLEKVTNADVQQWLAGLLDGTEAVKGKPLSHSRVKKLLLCMRQIMDVAVAEGYLYSSPISKTLKAGKTPIPTINALTHEQVAVLASKMPSREMRLLVEFLAYTGLRVSEAAALRVEDVDLVSKRVVVKAATVEVTAAGVGLVEKGTKTHSVRQVPIPAFLIDPLREQMEGKTQQDRLFNDYLTLGTLRPTYLRKMIQRASKHAKLPFEVNTKDLRDTAASLAIQAGASVKTVQAMLGHASAHMTLTRYAGFFPEDFDTLNDRLSEARTRKLNPEQIDSK